MYYLDLFSGIGGFALGTYWAGWRFEGHYFSEVEPYCIELYKLRFPQAVAVGDIRKLLHEIPLPRGDWIISGGFPCQDISIAGKGEGISGERSNLWFEMWRVIRILRPQFAIIENVGAITHRGLCTVLGCLAEIGYDAEWTDIRASDMGAPHRRERIWIIAYPQCSRRGKKQKCELGSKNKTIFKNDGKKNWWRAQSNLGRVVYGIPPELDRLKALGNSIIPQIAELLFRRLKEIEDERLKET